MYDVFFNDIERRMDNHYETLKVSQNATTDEINKAYKKLALKNHPDRKGTEEERKIATVEFQKIAAAKDVLLDEESRRTYDQELRDANKKTEYFKNNPLNRNNFPQQQTPKSPDTEARNSPPNHSSFVPPPSRPKKNYNSPNRQQSPRTRIFVNVNYKNEGFPHATNFGTDGDLKALNKQLRMIIQIEGLLHKVSTRPIKNEKGELEAIFISTKEKYKKEVIDKIIMPMLLKKQITPFHAIEVLKKHMDQLQSEYDVAKNVSPKK
jgi:curved DNA-binding protein CbpA